MSTINIYILQVYVLDLDAFQCASEKTDTGFVRSIDSQSPDNMTKSRKFSTEILRYGSPTTDGVKTFSIIPRNCFARVNIYS